MIRPQKKTEHLLIGITKNFEKIFIQAHTKPQETLEFKLTQSRESFSFIQQYQLESDRWLDYQV